MNTKKILVFDVNDAVRPLMARLLERQGYSTIEARSGKELEDLLRRQPGEIHLLIGPLGGPGLSGVKLAKRVQALRPDTRVMLLEDGEAFLSKPFTFALKVRVMLEPHVGV